MPRASIDLGSNSLLLLVLDDEGRVLDDRATVVGLGAGLGDRGLFRIDRMDKAVEVLAAYAARAAELGVPPDQVLVAATSGARRALNAQTFLERVRRETGLLVRVVDGEEEALLTWRGAAAGLALPSGPLAVVDLGGGSTEVVLGEGTRLRHRVSLEIGSVRLSEQFLWAGAERSPDRVDPRDLARLKGHVREAFAAVQWEWVPRQVIAVAGTATTLAAMELGLEAWDAARVHGSRLERVALRRWIDRLLDADAEARRALARVAPSRADTLLAGACVLDQALATARRDSLRVSVGGVRHGLLEAPLR
jgi:exopolyphosphatase / guanosine-5'-triphosphate,3'-diphosphate pyrophosphatase